MSEFTDYLIELFEQFGPVQARKMFGGYGIYNDGIMFGLVADDTLYLKADKSNVQEFESRGLVPFEYNKAGKLMKMSYYLAPAEILDDPDAAAIWARRSFMVARSAQAGSGKKPSNRKKK